MAIFLQSGAGLVFQQLGYQQYITGPFVNIHILVSLAWFWKIAYQTGQENKKSKLVRFI
jgi:hypothetical protein